MMTFEHNLALVLAHSAVFFSREEWGPVSDARAEDDVAPSPSDSTAETLRAYHAYLPGLMKKIGKQLVPFEQQRLAAAQATSPGYSALQTQLYRDNAPELAQISQDIDTSNRLAGAQADLSVLAGPGQGIVDKSMGLLRETDPEFFGVREKAGQNILGLLGGGLSPAEEEALSRRIAQENVGRGTLGVPSAINTARDAMMFGDATHKRQMEALGAATSFLPVSRTGFDPTQAALGRPSINTGDSKFTGVQQESGQAGSLGQNVFDTIAGFQGKAMDINAQKRDWMDRVNEGVGSINF